MNTFTTRANDRWDLIASDLWQLPELGWAIAEANPDIADNLILSAEISLTLPELRSLRRPLTAANPAREDDGEFQQLPPQAPSPIVPPSGGGGSVVFPITVAQGGSGVDNAVAALEVFGGIAKNTKGVPNGVAPLDGAALVPSLNLPPYPTLTSLGGVSTTTFDNAIALKLDASARNAANGVAGLNANLLLALNQIPLGQFFPFTAGASFRGGGVPSVETTLVQAGVDGSGNPRLWLVNASAPAGNRLKSITIAANGNIQFRHHADNGTDGNVLEHTATGNALTNGTYRPGSGNTSFTGATFVPGAIYFRTDVTGDSNTGCLTYSDGTTWRRVSDGSLSTEPARLKKIITGTTASTQGTTTSIAHGLTSSKIISVSGVIFYSAGLLVPINSRQANYASVIAIDTVNFNLTNEATNSVGILSKFFTVVLEYTI